MITIPTGLMAPAKAKGMIFKIVSEIASS